MSVTLVWIVGFRCIYLRERSIEKLNFRYEQDNPVIPLNPTYVYIHIIIELTLLGKNLKNTGSPHASADTHCHHAILMILPTHFIN